MQLQKDMISTQKQSYCAWYSPPFKPCINERERQNENPKAGLLGAYNYAVYTYKKK